MLVWHKTDDSDAFVQNEFEGVLLSLCAAIKHGKE
jgi:hypothetical protein